MTIRVTSSRLFRSGAQTLLGEHWVDSRDELAAAVECLTQAAVARWGQEIGEGSSELVFRVAERRFLCLDPPADRAAAMGGPGPARGARHPAAGKRLAERF